MDREEGASVFGHFRAWPSRYEIASSESRKSYLCSREQTAAVVHLIGNRKCKEYGLKREGQRPWLIDLRLNFIGVSIHPVLLAGSDRCSEMYDGSLLRYEPGQMVDHILGVGNGVF